jgi:zinc protease
MSKKLKMPVTLSKNFKHLKTVEDISEYRLNQNGLRLLYKYIPDTGIVTTNITYLVGARDEQVGETGVAHMLEHMLFKPTKQDRERKTDSGAVKFEREVGAVLNANTWKDRTTYYFSYGIEHFPRVLQIEAERMRDVELIDKEFLPERTNVLSEFDMYNGDPHFALSVAMNAAAFLSHPYGHETIGFREDISAYTVTKLQKFYNHFYRPNNAVLMIIGDIKLSDALQQVDKAFGKLIPEPAVEIRETINEPTQEGIRRTEVVRPGTTNILAIGVKHPGFLEVGWYETMAALRILAEGSDSVLHKELVDTGLASSVSCSQNPVKDTDLATINITLTAKTNHAKMEVLVRKIVEDVEESLIKKQLKNIVTKTISDEIFNRDSSLDIAAELTEYVSAGDWTAYFATEKLLRSLTAKQVKARLNNLFKETSLTIGNYKSI